MTDRYLTELADWLRDAGLNVAEVPGWQTRSRSTGGYATGRPWCCMWHHTASGAATAGQVSYESVGSDVAPICNLHVAPNGVVYVIAAGATNTNGQGGPLTFSRGTVSLNQMNTYAVGMEIANNGVGGPYPAVQIDACLRTSLAVTEGLGLEPDDVALHYTWAPTRKIDPATACAVEGPWHPHAVNAAGTWSLDDLRTELRRRARPPTPDPNQGDDDMVQMYLLRGPSGQMYATDRRTIAVYVDDGDMGAYLRDERGFDVGDDSGPSPCSSIEEAFLIRLAGS